MSFLDPVATWLANPTNCLALFGTLAGGLSLYLQWRFRQRRLRVTFKVESPLGGPRYEPYLRCEIVNLGVPVTITNIYVTNARDWGSMANLVDPKLPKRLERFEALKLRMSGSGFWNSQKGAPLQDIFFETECGLMLRAKRKTVREWNAAVQNMVDGKPPKFWSFMREGVRIHGQRLPPPDPDKVQ